MTREQRQTRYRVAGMDCASCAAKIDTAVRRMPGIEDVKVSVVAGTMTTTDNGSADLDAVRSKVESLGYKASKVGDSGLESQERLVPANDHDDSCQDDDHHHHHDHDRDDHSHRHEDRTGAPGRSTEAPTGTHGHDHGPLDGPWWKTSKAQLTIVCALALGAAFLAGQMLPQTQPWGFIIAMFVGLIPIARRAYMGAINGSPFSIETLMTVAAIGAVIIGATEEAAVVVLLFLVGELLEGIAASRARASITALADLMPKTALLEMDGETRTVPSDSLTVGAVILVRPRARQR